KNMFSPKVILLPVLVMLTVFSAQAQKPEAMEWSIGNYFKNLPKKYKTFRGDFDPLTKETTIIDEPNGYAAYLSHPIIPDSINPPFPIFETALFKSQIEPPLLVVSNLIDADDCSDYETFFLRRVGSNWTEVKSRVLPPLDLKMFWDAPQSSERLLKLIKRNFIAYHFEPPRRGTQMKVSLEICYRIAGDSPDEKVQEFEKLVESAKPIYLDWDKQTGKFKFAK
ncbi:MAG: hypothetical protein LH614_10665, partial [Pyrinomonadaceae bacterium]|nr:hypothetical protein [Pyrinomonadaceae bacterium]